MSENPETPEETDIWQPTRTDVLVLAIGVVFVLAAALVTLVLPDTPGWTFLANFGLSAGVAIALIGVLLRFQMRIERELQRLGDAVEKNAASIRRLEGTGEAYPAGADSARPKRSARSAPTVRWRDDVAPKSQRTGDPDGRWHSFVRHLEEWWESAQRPYRPKTPREPLFRLPEPVRRATAWFFNYIINPIIVVVGVLIVAALVLSGVLVTFVFAFVTWNGLLADAGLASHSIPDPLGDNKRGVMLLAGLTTAILAGFAAWVWARVRFPVAVAASMATLVGLAAAQYGFGIL